MAVRKAERTDVLIGVVLFVGVLVVYIVSLCPTVYVGESLNAVTAVTRTAFVKSVQYPVWQFLGRIFASPWPNKAWALNLFSAICGAASIALLYRVFARFGHTRTRDEQIRFRGQPNLARFAAVSAALLVAFSHTFWRASVTAGMHTLNALLLVLVTHLLLCYRETRKKRYFMLYGALYAIGMANFPTMTLLLPLYVVLSIVWCREVFSDLITLVVTLVVSVVLFAVGVLAAPLGFASNLPKYFNSPMPVTRPMFDYLTWYWSQIRPSLPLGGLGGGMLWVLWLVLPTLPPVLYLSFTKRRPTSEIGRGSAITAGILRGLMLCYTALGVLALLDLYIGPYGMVGQEGFVVAYMVIGGWLCYMLGYWAVVVSGKRPMRAEAPARRYSRPAYAVLIVLFLALPVVSAAMHYRSSGLRGFTLAEDFAYDTLESAGDRSAILITSGDGWGDLLNYVLKYRYGKETAPDILLVDLHSAQSYDGRYISMNDYLREVTFGTTPGQIPRQLDPALNPGLSLAEAATNLVSLGARAARTGSRRICLTGDADLFNPKSEQLSYALEFVPLGLVYRLSGRDHYRNKPEEHIEAGKELWGTLRTPRIKPRPLDQWPVPAQSYIRRASKLANDFGVYCHQHAGEAEAVKFYELALALNDANYSPLFNLSTVSDDQELHDQLRRAGDAGRADVDARVRAFVGAGASQDTRERATKFIWAFTVMQARGWVRDGQIINDFLEYNPAPEARSFEYRYALVSLGVLVDPEGKKGLADRGRLFVGMRADRGTLPQRVRALMDLQEAEPYVDEDVQAEVKFLIGGLQGQLGNLEAAEQAFKAAIEMKPDFQSPYGGLAEIYAAQQDRRDDAIRLVKDVMKQRPPTNRQELMGYLTVLRRYYLVNDDSEGFLTYATEYAEANPEDARDTKMFLLELALAEKDFERAKQIANDLVANHDAPVAAKIRLVEIAYTEERFEDVLAAGELPADADADPGERLRWHAVRGDALLRLGRASDGLDEMKKAYAIEVRRAKAARRLPALDMLGRISRAGMMAALETGDPDLKQEALDYGLVFYQAARADPTPQNRLLAADYYGWMLWRLEGDVETAEALIVPAMLGNPTQPSLKLHYGALLIGKGEVERGVALIKKARQIGLGPFSDAEAVEILEEQGIEVEEAPAEPEATEDITVSTEPDEPADD